MNTLIGRLGKFAAEKAAGVVSKRVAASAGAVAILAPVNPELAGGALICYTICETVWRCWDRYCAMLEVRRG